MNPEFAEFKFPDKPILTFGELEQQEQEPKNSSDDILRCGRNPVFWFPSGNNYVENGNEQQEDAIDDDFFQISQRDVKTRQRLLKEEARLLSERGFISRDIVEMRNSEAKQLAYKHSLIRFSIRKKIFVQAQFLTAEPVSRLYEFIVSLLRDPNLLVELYAPSNIRLDSTDSRDLLTAGLAPRTMLILNFSSLDMKELDAQNELAFIESIFSFDGDTPIIKCTVTEADRIGAEWLSVNTAFNPFETTIPDPEAITKQKEDKAQEVMARLTGAKRGATKEQSTAKRSNITEEGDQGGGDHSSLNQSQQKKADVVPKWFKKPM